MPPGPLHCAGRLNLGVRRKLGDAMKAILALLVLALAGCANPGVIRLSPDTYIVSRQDLKGVFGNESSLKAKVIREANEFAESQGKAALPISSEFTPMGGGPAQWASFEYQFRLVDKNDPRLHGSALIPRADVVVEHDDSPRSTDKSTDPPVSTDTYTQLLRLDDLRQRGILSEAEFQAEKEKLLKGQ